MPASPSPPQLISMSTPSSKVQLKRPAAIELRFNNAGQYKRYIKFYHKALGLGPIATVPEPVYSLPVGLTPANAKTPDMELRFVLLKNRATKDKPVKVRTIIYWQIDNADLLATQQSLKKDFRYDAVDSTVGTLSNDPRFFLLQAADSTAPSAAPAKIASRDGDGNSMGLVINPPYPRYTDSPPSPGEPGPGFLPGTPLGLGLLGLALGLVLGLLIARLLRSRTAVR